MYTLYCGDNVQIMRDEIKDESIDMILTSPPYDILDKELKTIPRQMRSYNGYDWDFVSVANESYRVLKQGGVLVWVVGDVTIDGSETGTPERQKLYFMDTGFKCADTMIYEQAGTGAKGSNKTYWQTWEYMYVFSKGDLKTYNLLQDRKNKSVGGYSYGRGSDKEGINKNKVTKVKTKLFGKRTNIWRYSSNKNKGIHPAPFPEKLAYDHIISWSNEGDTILDMFVGSGTTIKMCEILKRNSIGIDCSQEYIDDIPKRLIGITDQLPDDIKEIHAIQQSIF